MANLVQNIVNCLTTDGCRLSVVKNPDGFLLRPDTQQRVLASDGLLLLPINSSLELRVRYELEDKYSDNRVCYIMDNIDDILPDMVRILYVAPVFTIAKILPVCHEMELISFKPSFNAVEYIFNKHLLKNLSFDETRSLLAEAEATYGCDPQQINQELRSIPLRWEECDTMDSICRILLKAISKGAYREIEPVIEELNADFQKFVDSRYFSCINSSSIKRPKMVHKILPHLAHAHERYDKIALIVVDGLTYWQYLILDEALKDKGVLTKCDITYAWLPSITKLSRQAIFRGKAPQIDYRQTASEESKLWVDFWTSQDRKAKQMQRYEVGYTHGSLSTDECSVLRQACVDVHLDEKLHSLDDNKDLFSLTRNWAEQAANDIKAIHEQGYNIYITTDHGNVLANPWRALNSHEKTFLYEKESRGCRHMIYSDAEHLNDFLSSNTEISDDLFVYENWAVWRGAKGFSNKGGITHGGAHFLEVIIPFITIEKK